MIKSKKTPHSISKVRKPAKRGDREEESWRTKPMILALGDSFKKWCKEEVDDPKSRRLVVERFWIDRNIHPNLPGRWAKKYNEFKEDYEIGKAYIGVKKLTGIYLREYEPNKTTFLLNQLLPSWKEAEKYHQELKNITDIIDKLKGIAFEVPDLEDDRELERVK